MSTYKVGDKIKIVQCSNKSSHYQEAIGKIFKIKHMEDGVFFIEKLKHLYSGRYFFVDEIELVKNKQLEFEFMRSDNDTEKQTTR